MLQENRPHGGLQLLRLPGLQRVPLLSHRVRVRREVVWEVCLQEDHIPCVQSVDAMLRLVPQHQRREQLDNHPEVQALLRLPLAVALAVPLLIPGLVTALTLLLPRTALRLAARIAFVSSGSFASAFGPLLPALAGRLVELVAPELRLLLLGRGPRHSVHLGRLACLSIPHIRRRQTSEQFQLLGGILQASLPPSAPSSRISSGFPLAILR